VAGGDDEEGHRDGGVGGGVRVVSVVEARRQGLVEHEVWVGLGVRRIEGGGLIEEEVALWRAARGGAGRGTVGEVDVEEDGGYDGRVGEKGEDGHLATAGGAEERQDIVDASEEHGPSDPRWAGAPSRFRIGRSLKEVRRWGWGRLSLGPTDGDDDGSGSSVRGKHAVVPMAVHAGRWDEPGEALQELEGGEHDLGAPIGRGFGEPIEEPCVGRGEGGRSAQGVKALEGEGWPGAVTDQAFDARTVLTLDANGSVDAEAAGALPGEHALGIGLVEKAARVEVPEHAALDDTREVEPVVFVEDGGLIEADSSVGGLREEAVKDHEMEVEVGIEGRSESVQEGDGAELGIRGRAGTGGSERRTNGAQEDPQDGAGDVRVVVEVWAQALGQGPRFGPRAWVVVQELHLDPIPKASRSQEG
jgi:hypothetical protein